MNWRSQKVCQRKLSVLYLLFMFFFCIYLISIGKSWMYVFKEYSVIFLYLSFVGNQILASLLPEIPNFSMVRMFKIFWNLQVAVIFMICHRPLRPIVIKDHPSRVLFALEASLLATFMSLIMWGSWCEVMYSMSFYMHFITLSKLSP